MNKKALSLLSLCARAGKLVAGEEPCEKALKDEIVHFVIVGEDASDNTKKKFINKTFYYKVPVKVWGTREEISKAIGKNNRVVVAITDDGFAANLQKLAEADEDGNMEVAGCQKREFTK